jgi:hypothetical protein
MATESPPEISMPTEEELKQLPSKERLAQAAEAASAAANSQNIVSSLRAKAAAITNPKERERMLSEAYNKEIEAKGLSKKAKILQSGTFQGGLGGLGIGAATGAGLGTVVGTLVGTVATIPTSAVGTLAGMGVGAIHGPWVKLGGGGKKEGEGGAKEQMMQIPQQAIDSGAVVIDKVTGSVTARDPEALKEAATAAEDVAQLKESAEQREQGAQTQEKRKPKKLEIRSKQDGQSKNGNKEESKTTDPKPAKRKPPKLEVRNKAAAQTAA